MEGCTQNRIIEAVKHTGFELISSFYHYILRGTCHLQVPFFMPFNALLCSVPPLLFVANISQQLAVFIPLENQNNCLIISKLRSAMVVGLFFNQTQQA